MPDLDPCEVCGSRAKPVPTGGFDGIEQDCPRCGRFRLTGTACSMLRYSSKEEHQKLSGWIYDKTRLGEVPTISSDTLKTVVARRLPALKERCQRLLSAAVEIEPQLGKAFTLHNPRFVAATYSKDLDEVLYLSRMVQEQGFLRPVAKGGEAEITPRGHLEAEQVTKPRSATSTAFVAMWFSDELQSAYDDGISLAILRAGYDPVRVDLIEHIDRIDDLILEQIRSARFIVADFSGHRGGVYFEAGFAKALNIPVIWACRRLDMHELHFDIRQYNCIEWDNPAELADKLQKRIIAVIGERKRG